MYVRDQGDGNFDIVNNPGGTCGIEPDGWEPCGGDFPGASEACDGVC